jgi:hypothetical protein
MPPEGTETPPTTAGPVPTPTPAPVGARATPRSSVETGILIANTVKDFLKEALTWVVALVALALVFRRPLGKVLERIPDVVGGPGLTLEVPSFIKVQLTERPVVTAPDLATCFFAFSF